MYFEFWKKGAKVPAKKHWKKHWWKTFLSSQEMGKLFLAIKKDIILEMISSKFTVFLFVLVEIVLVWVQKSLTFLFSATWFISHVGRNTELFFTNLQLFGKAASHDKKSQISENFLMIKSYWCFNKVRYRKKTRPELKELG